VQRDDDDGAATPLLVGVKANAAVAEEHRRISVASILMVPEFVHKSLCVYLPYLLVGEEVCCSCHLLTSPPCHLLINMTLGY